jgi:hypothetical protein
VRFPILPRRAAQRWGVFFFFFFFFLPGSREGGLGSSEGRKGWEGHRDGGRGRWGSLKRTSLFYFLPAQSPAPVGVGSPTRRGRGSGQPARHERGAQLARSNARCFFHRSPMRHE